MTEGNETHPIIRGVKIRTRVLCEPISPPPPGLDIQPLTHPADKTTRQAVEEATGDAACQSCHLQMNPLGFLSESYDPTGRFRQSELRFADGSGEVVAELPIDTRATPAIGENDTTEIVDAVDLGQYIADSGAANVCLVASYFEFANGRPADPVTDGCDVLGLRDELTREGGSIKRVLIESVMQQSFRKRLVK